MKKIFSILCAAVVALSASAAPQFAVKKAMKPVMNHHLQKNISVDVAQLPAAPQRVAKAAAATTDLSNQILTVECAYYSAPEYSQPGAYDYYFMFEGALGAEYGVPEPLVTFDLYLPTNTGLVDGTYTMAAGQIDAVALCLEELDYLYLLYGMLIYEIVDAQLTIATVSANVYNFNLTMTDSEGEVYTIVKNNVSLVVEEVTDGPGTEALQYDTEDTDFSQNFTSASVYTYVMNDGSPYAVVQAVSGAKEVLLYFFYEAADPTYIIPNGTYDIDGSLDFGTVYASEGVDEEGYITGSFAGTAGEDGYIADVWFMVDGEVTVNNGVITVNAVNSYDRTIQATISGLTITALENVEATSASKKIVNGQLVIEKDGVLYNALGTVVK